MKIIRQRMTDQLSNDPGESNVDDGIAPAKPVAEKVSPDPPKLRLLWEFLLHVLVGCCLFLIIFAPAVGLQMIVNWATELALGKFLVILLLLAEYAIVLADTLLLVVFLCKTTFRTIKKL